MAQRPDEPDRGGERDLPEVPSGFELAPGVVLPWDRLTFRFVRSSGPGGQNVNKRSTKVELRVWLWTLPVDEPARERLRARAGKRLTDDGELVIASDEHRTQGQNRAECLDRLRRLVAASLKPPKPRIKTKPTKGSRRRRLDAKRRRGDTKRGRGSSAEGWAE
ncbi:MAG: aminoacyl-tRNA hydrolase [Phycisphaerales bacterium]|nr:aminoacyl-tRNA hydrolase [Phycisphaerales bacterium]